MKHKPFTTDVLGRPYRDDRSVPDSSVAVGRADAPWDELPPLDRELLSMLLQVPMAAQRNAVYPPGHPLAVAATRRLLASLSKVLTDRGSLTVAVARTRLVIGDAATDPDHALLRDLAQRLHRAEIATVTVIPGVGEQELGELLAYVGADAPRGHGAPAATPAAATELPEWPHILLALPAFDQLRLAGDADAQEESREAKLTRLWGELATAAAGIPDSEAQAPPEDPAALARLIEAQPRDLAYDRAVMRRLLALGRAARGRKGAFSLAVQQQLTELLVNLKPETLFHLLSLGADVAERQSLIRDVSRAMPVGGILEVIRASAQANEKTISTALMRIFEKLAANAESGGGKAPAESDEGLRELVASMLEGWVLKDPNPLGYTSALDRLVTVPRPGASADGAEGGPSYAEHERVVQMALELGVQGQAVDEAVDQLVERGHVAVLTKLLADAPADSPVADAMWNRLATPDLVRRLLEDEGTDIGLLDTVLPRLGLAAAEPLLDALEIAQSLTSRRRLLTWLGRLGPSIGPLVIQRLDASAWYVQRNMLVLLAALPEWPAEFNPAAYLGHREARVRREAFKLAVRVPALRDEAICVGLEDRDEQVIGLALRTAADGCPGRALPIIIANLARGHGSADLRAQFIRALGTIHSPRARDWLINRCLVKRWWLGTRLAAKNAEVLAAVTGLATTWARDPRAETVLALARQSADAEVRTAAELRTAPS
jgi:hypothetical protein